MTFFISYITQKLLVNTDSKNNNKNNNFIENIIHLHFTQNLKLRQYSCLLHKIITIIRKFVNVKFVS